MNSSWQDNERLADLLVKEAAEGLTSAESIELQALLRTESDVERDAMDAAVASVWLAGPVREKMPETLRAKIIAASPVDSATTATSSSSTPTPITAARRKSSVLPPSAGWWAAAACFVLAVLGWWPRIVNAPSTTLAHTDPLQDRKALLSAPTAVQASMTSGPYVGNQALAGDVVFDPVTQRGYLRFRGIPANDPRLAQYQLWIADASRSYPEPVDGGVFNVGSASNTPAGDVIIPFQAKLPVGKPAAFVVTVERPGGVVVSRQDKVVAVAKVGA